MSGLNTREIMRYIIAAAVIALFSLLLGPAAAHPGMDIGEYYDRATPITDDFLPHGLRVAKWVSAGRVGSAPPLITSRCLRYGPGEFSHLFLNSPSSRRMREVFAENGVNVDKLTNLLRAHSVRGPETVAIFDEGYLVLTDGCEKANYIVPIRKGVGRQLFPLTE